MQNPKQVKPFNPHSAAKAAKSNLIIGIIALIIAIIAGFFAIFAWVEGSKLNKVADATKQLNRSITQERIQTTSEMQQLKSSLHEQAQALSNTQRSLANLLKLANNTETQRTLSEVSYLLHLANLHLRIAHDTKTSLKLLKMAQNRLLKEANPTLFSLKHAVSNDINALKSIAGVDVTGLIIRLDNLNQDISRIPLIPKAPTAQAPSKTQKEKFAEMAWYKRFWHDLGGLKNLIVIRHIQKPVAPLLSPKQVTFLKENIEFKLSQAQYAVMHQMPAVYKKNLELVKQWINTYYHDPDAIKQINAKIDELVKVDIKPKLPSLENSLSALQQTLVLERGFKTENKPQILKLQPAKQQTKQIPQQIVPPKKQKSQKTTPKEPKTTTRGVEV